MVERFAVDRDSVEMRIGTSESKTKALKVIIPSEIVTTEIEFSTLDREQICDLSVTLKEVIALIRYKATNL